MVSKARLAIDWPVFQPRGWGRPSSARAMPKPWYGLDTERDSKTGEFVTGWAVSETEKLPFKQFTDLPPATYWIWNLGYDIEGMLRDLRLPEAWAAKSDGSAFTMLDGIAVYYHGKRFDFKRGTSKWNFIEASSFFGRCGLADVGPKRPEIDASKMSLERYRQDSEYREQVDAYCIQDARIVYDAITDLNAGVMALGVDLGSTPGATARRFLTRLGAFPEVLWRTHKPFLRSYCGGRFEITKRGILHDVNQYDLVSAYPWALSKCPWLSDGATERLTRRFSDTALYGSYEVAFSYDNYLGVAPRWRNGIRVYSKREDATWLTRPEVEWLLNQGAKVTILRGVEVFDENATNLWEQVITELFAQKVRGAKTALGLGAKIILNSQYGILIQLIRRTGKWKLATEAVNPVDFAGILALEEAPKAFEGGKYFAPLYAGNLTGLTRIRLLDAALDMGSDSYAGGHTDSVLGMGRLHRGIGIGLGDWKLEKHAERAEICKTGMYSLDSSVKFRGILKKKGTPDMLWTDTHIRKSRTSIKSASSWDEVSVILPKTVVNNYQIENKRKWHGEVTRGLLAMERYVDSEALECVVE